MRWHTIIEETLMSTEPFFPPDGIITFARSPLARSGDPIAADVVARAIMRGVFHAADIAGHQSYATRWGAFLRGSG